MSEQQKKIKLVIVDDIVETRQNLINLLYFERDIEIIDSATNGLEAIEKAKKLQPDIVLMDINMPGMNGIQATEKIVQQVPGTAVIIMSVQGEQDYLRQAMRAGAREFLVKPFAADELVSSVRHVYQEVQATRKIINQVQYAPTTPSADGGGDEAAGEIISIFSPKGGVGRTAIITNLAVAVKQLSKKRVALVDGSLFFGDVGLMMDVRNTKTMTDLQGRMEGLDAQLLQDVMLSHSTEVKVLLAPPKPDQGELISADDLKKILREMRNSFDYIFVDTYPSLKEETQLTILDMSDTILTVMSLEMPAIKDVRLFLEITEILEYPKDKIALILNKADAKHGLKAENIEGTIGHPIAATISSSPATVTLSINRGTPLVIDAPDDPFSKDIGNLARKIVNGTLGKKEVVDPKKQQAKAGLFGGLFGGKKK